MTTSFAWFVRADVAGSWRANPAGVFLASACLLSIPWLLAVAIRGRPWPFRDLELPLVGMSVAVVALTLISWMIRLILGGR